MSAPAIAVTPRAESTPAVIATGVAQTPAEADKDIFKNELILGIGVTALGGLIGLAYGIYKNSEAKKAGAASSALKSDAIAALEGALIGAIIAAIAVLVYRIYFHATHVTRAYQAGRITPVYAQAIA
ncbi:hypothetical protein ml_355 [Mollivirus sibericum]|uniref:hypothetical protein n=1 Tax=Mollivirus sibericum TaxID=1678078 RepID=UPI0006B2E7A5|nr:hypothetical protein ml_355 [Mollivirus sibericum]ALD62157.1 hypothetical protein ml_355 [Mollivirus sibericum]QHN71317.1 hypothetical protein [Mollivirus kamchatka]